MPQDKNQQPPKVPRPGSSAQIPIITDEVQPGAVHSFHPPPLPLEQRPTARPPAPDPRPPPRSSMVGVRAQHEDERTLVGLGPKEPLPPARDKLDSVEVTNGSLLDLVAEKNVELAKLRAELAAKKVTVEPATSTDLPTRAQWHALLYKLGGAVLAILVPCGAYLAYRVETLVPRVTTTESKQETQKKTTSTVEDRVKALEKFSRAHAKWDHCMNAERDSAIERGTGHKVESEHDDVPWVEENAPPMKIRILWSTAPWSIEKGSSCGAEPAPPHSPTE